MASSPLTSRSVASCDDIQSLSEAVPRSSLVNQPLSLSSTATTLPIGDTLRAGKELSPASASTSTSTHERLRQAETERDRLRERLEHERTVADRFEREGGAGFLSITEEKSRIDQLKKDIHTANAESTWRSTTGLFKAACSTDLLFLMDTTGSMASYINAAKEQVKGIVSSIGEAFLNEAVIRIAVVGCKDHGDIPSIEFLDFTTDADAVRTFIDGLKATGGNDTPEDVLGGIRQALNATWKNQTRCMIHIADAPPHGINLQNSAVSGDRWPKPGTEPHGLTYYPLLQQMVGLKLNYALLRINNTTDNMAFSFLKVYASAGAECKLYNSNKYLIQSRELFSDVRSGFLSKKTSMRSSKGGLLFEELALGTTYDALRHLVVKNVTTSASRTAVRMSTGRNSKATGRLDSNLLSINEDGDGGDNARLETGAPRWHIRGWLNETLTVEGFSPEVVVHQSSTLDDMMEHDDNIKMSTTELTIHKRSKPFAQGAMRVAAYAKTTASTNRFVVKSFKKGGRQLAHLAEDMRCQALCKAFALEFNAFAEEKHAIDFIVTTCLKGKSRKGAREEVMSLEPFIEGTYVKYNSNCGYVNVDNPDDPFNKAAQAFSHFTFERSRGRFLVSDLQGVGNILTDPVIHTLDPERFKLVDPNLGEEGFKFFFASHKCNDICKKLELKSNASMIISGAYYFRLDWPIMDNTVCCSNKLCGKIVRLASAKKSDEFPEYHWCDTCWPQLFSFKTKLMCTAPGSHHEFEVSKFFHEAQGRSPPRRCREHRGLDGERFGLISQMDDTSPYRGGEPMVYRPMAELDGASTSWRSPQHRSISESGWRNSMSGTPIMESADEISQAPTQAPEMRSSPLMSPEAHAPSRSYYQLYAEYSPAIYSESKVKGETVTKSALASGKLWDRLKSATRRRSMSFSRRTG